MKPKRRTTKITGTNAAKAWKMARAGTSYVDIATEIGYTTTRVKQFINKKYKDEADTLWAKYIKRDGKCMVPGCKRKDLDAHHMISKGSHPHLRFELFNGVPLCSYHHMYDPDISGHSGCSAAVNLWESIMFWDPYQFQWLQEHKEDKSYQEVYYDTEYERLREFTNGQERKSKAGRTNKAVNSQSYPV